MERVGSITRWQDWASFALDEVGAEWLNIAFVVGALAAALAASAMSLDKDFLDWWHKRFAR
jgi:hypothetical protein